MAASKLREQSMSFSVSIIELVKQLKTQRESIISNQIGRSGTSIGANIYEAQYAHSKPDFIAKLQMIIPTQIGILMIVNITVSFYDGNNKNSF